MTLDLSQNAASKLEPFLLMAKGAKGAAAAKLIQDATSAPGVFVFSELLEIANIQELSKGEQASSYRMLELFAYGTYEEYSKSKDSIPVLNQAQLTKLRLLTIISLSHEKRMLPYSLLLDSLQVPTIRELEDLIIDGIYLDLMRGKLDQKRQQFEVEYTIGRDLGPGKIENLLSSLQEWARTTSAVLTALDTQLAQIASQDMLKKTAENEHIQSVEQTLLDIAKKQKESKSSVRGTGVLDSDRDESMDVDELRSVGNGRVESSTSQNDVKTRKSNPRTLGLGYDKPSSRKRNRF